MPWLYKTAPATARRSGAPPGEKTHPGQPTDARQRETRPPACSFPKGYQGTPCRRMYILSRCLLSLNRATWLQDHASALPLPRGIDPQHEPRTLLEILPGHYRTINHHRASSKAQNSRIQPRNRGRLICLSLPENTRAAWRIQRKTASALPEFLRRCRPAGHPKQAKFYHFCRNLIFTAGPEPQDSGAPC